MTHPANWANELRGCISIGYGYAIMLQNGIHRQAVTCSRNVFREFMNEPAGHDYLQIDIRQSRP